MTGDSGSQTFYEIERKFLLSHDGWRPLVAQQTTIRQGYLNQDRHCSVRIRIADAKATLNLKGATLGASRLEFEYPVPLEEAHILLDQLALGPQIEKIRHHVPWGPHVFEIDEFLGDNLGLVVAEIELNAVDEPFERPDWLGLEVTEDVRYYNTALSLNPFRNWSSP